MYDITDFAKSHPGGAQLLALAVGRDATILFESHHVLPEIVAKTLKTLDLSQNDIADFGARQLAEALQRNSALTVLELESNAIGDAGATDLAKALEVNSTLGVLRLQSNPIGARGEGWLAQATGGFNRDREIFLRAFDPSRSFTFGKPIDELTAKVRGPGGAVTNELGNMLIPTVDEFALPEPGSEATGTASARAAPLKLPRPQLSHRGVGVVDGADHALRTRCRHSSGRGATRGPG